MLVGIEEGGGGSDIHLTIVLVGIEGGSGIHLNTICVGTVPLTSNLNGECDSQVTRVRLASDTHSPFKLLVSSTCTAGGIPCEATITVSSLSSSL